MPVNKAREERRQKIKKEIESLEAKSAHPEDFTESKYFDDLPLSKKTIIGLKRANFRLLTEIQRKAIPLALAKRDVLGAAKTGSGKTLGFLVPVLEILYRIGWSAADGLGALIISPTRELAVQIFEVLRKIGREHSFSAGLVIGGKDFKVEKDRISRMNILVATPGRLLQHMDQSFGFDCSNLQILVLDEADRIMDMGFQKTVNAIIENLPRERQTLLFSATQTRSVKDLARLSLHDPEYVAVHEKAEHSTPQTLTQHYVICELPKKLDILYSFIKTHLKTKTIVFLSSCKQTRFVYESFCKLQPGVPLLHLHGKQKQHKRVEIYNKFTTSKFAVLFCTDIAARGLDFPAVDWVVQLDCPEDPETYIHRVGRTARLNAEGHALLMLLPTEAEAMIELLRKKKVPIEEIKIRENKKQSIRNQLQSFCFKDPEMKYLAQRAFVSYMRSVYLQRNKDVFKVHELPAEEFADSLGLPGAPKIKFVAKAAAKAAEKASKIKRILEEDDSADKKNENAGVKTKYDRMFQRKNQDILSEHYNKLVDLDGDRVDQDDDEEDFLTVRRANHDIEENDEEQIEQTKAENLSKRQLKMTKKERAKKQPKGHKIIFDDDGNPHEVYEMIDEEEFLKAGDPKLQKEAYLKEKEELMKTADVEDKQIMKEKRKEKKLKRKMREKEMMEAGQNMDEYESESAEDYEESDKEQEDESEEESGEESEDEERKAWKRKWEEDLQEPVPTKKRVIEAEEPVTLQDQEALALKLLGGM